MWETAASAAYHQNMLILMQQEQKLSKMQTESLLAIKSDVALARVGIQQLVTPIPYIPAAFWGDLPLYARTLERDPANPGVPYRKDLPLMTKDASEASFEPSRQPSI